MWTTPKDLKAQLLRLWERGELLRDIITGNHRFPLRMTCKTPDSNDITTRFEQVRAWSKMLINAPMLRLEWQTIHHRIQGQQQIPARIWIDSAQTALNWIGKSQEWQQFYQQVTITRQTQASLLPWLEKHPLQALALANNWQQLLNVINWIKNHPRPNIYLRQVSIPGIHSKFIETHRAVLNKLLDLTLPPEQIDHEKTGINLFTARYGFRQKPTLIRLRILDETLNIIPGIRCPDITLDADSFSRLTLNIRRVIITENEINFLALPEIPETIAIFGSGYGWHTLAQAHWLNQCAIHYWGDIDTHGFAILAQLRACFSHVSSFLMDRATLDAHKNFWGTEDSPNKTELHQLTPEEQALYHDLKNNHLQKGLRLEQEHIHFDRVRQHLAQWIN